MLTLGPVPLDVVAALLAVGIYECYFSRAAHLALSKSWVMGVERPAVVCVGDTDWPTILVFNEVIFNTLNEAPKSSAVGCQQQEASSKYPVPDLFVDILVTSILFLSSIQDKGSHPGVIGKASVTMPFDILSSICKLIIFALRLSVA